MKEKLGRLGITDKDCQNRFGERLTDMKVVAFGRKESIGKE